MNRSLQSSTIKVAGAELYFESQGSGPALLMIPGGPADAGFFAAIVEELAGQFTVVCYDPRGNSRSVLDGEPAEQNVDVHGDDAAQLLAMFGEGPAFVLGSSGGAQIGLNLASRHPERVRLLVAHEPPCVRLLPDAAEQGAFADDVYAIYKASGVGAAMQRFAAHTGLGGPRPTTAAPPHPQTLAAYSRMRGNLEYFVAHGVKPISLYLPDIAALRGGKPRIMIGVGETSVGQLAYRAAMALAGRLGVEPVLFPGGHAGFTEFPAEFAAKLREVLESA